MIKMGWLMALVLLTVVTGAPASAETLATVLRAPHRQRVYDYAGVLSVAERTQLRRHLLALEPQHLAQGAIVVVRRVEGSTLERFARDLANRWGVGEKHRNNGFVILVAIDQRKWRLQTGDGLRKKIPDAVAAQLMREAVVPSFRRKRYAEGLEAAVAAIRDRASGVRSSAAAATTTVAAPGNPATATWHRPAFTPTLDPSIFLVGLGFVVVLLAACARMIAGPSTAPADGGLQHPSGTADDDSIRHTPAPLFQASPPPPVHHDYSPPPPPPTDYGGGSSSGGGASGDW